MERFHSILTSCTVSQWLVTLPILATYSMSQCLTPLLMSSLSLYLLQPMPGKSAGLQESVWVDAMMSGHQAAAFLTCVRPRLPFPFPGKVHKVQVVSQAMRHTSKCPTWWARPGPGECGGEHECVIWVCSPVLLPSVSALTTFF